MLIAFLFATAAAVPPEPVGNPAFWFDEKSYPIEAIKKEFQGSVDFEVEVDADGKPTACRISSSSGHPVLDQATCDAIRSKARFKAAKDADGKPIAGQYSNTAIWLMPYPPTPGHSALILDLSNDSAHPSCASQSAGSATDGHWPTCEQLLQRLEPFLPTMGQSWTKMVVLTSVAAAGQEPYRGESDWGARLSYLASDQYFLDDVYPVACVSVAAEGLEVGQDACAKVRGGPHSPDEAIKKNARKLRIETSIYAIRR